jgi:hypothetical protein
MIKYYLTRYKHGDIYAIHNLAHHYSKIKDRVNVIKYYLMIIEDIYIYTTWINYTQ